MITGTAAQSASTLPVAVLLLILAAVVVGSVLDKIFHKPKSEWDNKNTKAVDYLINGIETQTFEDEVEDIRQPPRDINKFSD